MVGAYPNPPSLVKQAEPLHNNEKIVMKKYQITVDNEQII